MLIPCISVSQNTVSDSTFVHPLNFQAGLSGTFGELRSNHLHSGLDYRTNEISGWPVMAIDSGYITRIKISPYGFGKAIYINHYFNTTSVYAHLHRFSDYIDSLTYDWMQQLKINSIDTILARGAYPIGRGELIAYSGNTGSSQGPHLHFELRNSQTQIPFNPPSFFQNKRDSISPIIKKLLVYDGFNFNLSQSRTVTLSTNIQTKEIHYVVDDTLFVNDCFAIGIECYDSANGYAGVLGIRELDLSIDDESVFHVVFDEFSFDESRYANACMDYELSKKDVYPVYRLHRMPGNKLSIYRKSPTTGIYCPSDDNEVLPYFITLIDQNNNRSFLSGWLRLVNEPSPRMQNTEMIIPNESFERQINEYSVYFNEQSVYKETPFYFSADSTNGQISFQILSEFDALHKGYTFRSNRPILIEKAGLYGMNNIKTEFLQSLEFDKPIEFNSTYCGKIELLIDSLSPELKNIEVISDTIYNRNFIELVIEDNLSGIEEITAYMNNEFVPGYYDLKANSFRIPIMVNSNTHVSLSIEVKDRAGNLMKTILVVPLKN